MPRPERIPYFRCRNQGKFPGPSPVARSLLPQRSLSFHIYNKNPAHCARRSEHKLHPGAYSYRNQRHSFGRCPSSCPRRSAVSRCNCNIHYRLGHNFAFRDYRSPDRRRLADFEDIGVLFVFWVRRQSRRYSDHPAHAGYNGGLKYYNWTHNRPHIENLYPHMFSRPPSAVFPCTHNNPAFPSGNHAFQYYNFPDKRRALPLADTVSADTDDSYPYKYNSFPPDKNPSHNVRGESLAGTHPPQAFCCSDNSSQCPGRNFRFYNCRNRDRYRAFVLAGKATL
jgi:hypothetical protein